MSIIKSDKALIVFAKAPVPGKVKTRLIPDISPENAARLYECFILDSIPLYQTLSDVSVLLYLESESDRSYFEEHFPELPCYVQEGKTLGERMEHAFEMSFSEYHRRVIIVGTDHPTLPLRTISTGYQMLDAYDDAIVIGPSEDGGYYALGMRTIQPELFRGIEYSTPTVYEETMKRLVDLDVTVHVLPKWYDIDTFEDILRLQNDLQNPELNGSVLTHTSACIQELADSSLLDPSDK